VAVRVEAGLFAAARSVRSIRAAVPFVGAAVFFIGVEPASRSGPGSVKGGREAEFRITN